MTGPSWRFPMAIDEAVRELTQPHAVAVAAGTTVLDLLKMGHYRGATFVDLTRLPLKGISLDGNRLRIGALVTNSDVAEAEIVRIDFPVLAQAIESGASQQIRNAATVGGNILQASRCSYFRNTDWPCNRRVPGSGCEAISAPTDGHAILGGSGHCIAVHPSDMAVALLALDAAVLVSGEDGVRTIALENFYRLPGEEPYATNILRQGDLLTAVEITRSDAESRSAYLKLRGRASYEFASASVAAVLFFEDGRPSRASIALGGVGTVPWRNRPAELALAASGFRKADIDAFCDRLLEEAELRPETSHKAVLARGAIHRVLAGLIDQ